MVRSINVTMDDEDYQDAKSVKDQLGLTWEEYINRAREELEGKIA